MKNKNLKTLPDGGQLVQWADGSEKIRVLLMERDDALRDREFIDYLIKAFREKGFAVSLLYPANEAFIRTVDPDFRLRKISPVLRKLWMGFSLLFHPVFWNFFIRSRRRSLSSFDYRAQSLVRAFQTLSPLPTFVLGRSSGARIASLVADQLPLAGIICIGFPFRNPKEGDEPERYRHLEFLKTPCLILQGAKDPYGGWGLNEKYKLSESITLKFIEVDHDFVLTVEGRLALMGDMEGFIFKNSG